MEKAIRSILSMHGIVFIFLLVPLMFCNPVSAFGEEESSPVYVADEGGSSPPVSASGDDSSPPPAPIAGEEAGALPASAGAEAEAPSSVAEEEGGTSASVAGEEKSSGDKYNFHMGGYVRTWASMNLQDMAETEGYDDQYKLSMLRGAINLDFDAKTGPFTWKLIARGDREYKTDYLKHLEEINQSGMNNFGSGANMHDSPGTEIMDQYNQGELREYYVEYDPLRRVHLRLGKQQVVWGETDFFRAMDVVNGFDYRWRFFLEPENEELRKPLILANATIQVPEIGGALQLIYRPGWDRPSSIGNTFPLTGGRWNPSPNHGLDVLGPVKYDYDHPDGDTDDPTWGARWSGIAGPVSYSLAYLKTLSNDPVMNSGISEFAFEKQSTGLLGDLIYPEVDLIGLTVSGHLPVIDSVLTTEIVYTFDQPFNRGSGGGSVDSLAGNNVGPPLLGKAVANGVGPGTDLVNRKFGGPDPDQLGGVVNYVLKPQGLTDDQLWKDVVPVLQLIYYGGAITPETLQALQVMAANSAHWAQVAANLGPNINLSELLTLPERIKMNPTGNRDIGRQNLVEAFYSLHKLIGWEAPLLVDWVAGLKGVIKKDTLKVMLRADKRLAFTQWLLGTQEPAFFTVQVFNNYIVDYDKEKDDIVYFVTYGMQKQELETMVTAVIQLNYLNQRITPLFAGGWDATYGGFFFIPTVEFTYGDHWRLRLEANFFFADAHKSQATINDAWLDLRPLTNDFTSGPNGRGSKYTLGVAGFNEDNTSFLGYFENNNQALVRLTYQF